MATVAIGWQVYSVRENPLDLGLVGLAEFLPLLLLALPAGHLADRLPRRRLWSSMIALDTVVLVGAPRRHGSRARTRSGRSSRSRSSGRRQRDRSARGPRAHALARAAGDPRRARSRSARSAFQLPSVAGPAVGGLLFAIQAELVYIVGIALSLVALALRSRAARSGACRRRTASRTRRGARRRAPDPPDAGAASVRSRSISSPCCSAARSRCCRSSRRTSSRSGRPGSGFLRAAPAVGAFLAALALARHPIRRRAGPTLFVVVAGFGASHGRLRALAADVALDARARARRRVRHGERRPALDDPAARDAGRAARAGERGRDGLHQRLERARARSSRASRPR